MAQKYLFIAISFYRNIVSRVNKALERRESVCSVHTHTHSLTHIHTRGRAHMHTV